MRWQVDLEVMMKSKWRDKKKLEVLQSSMMEEIVLRAWERIKSSEPIGDPRRRVPEGQMGMEAGRPAARREDEGDEGLKQEHLSRRIEPHSSPS